MKPRQGYVSHCEAYLDCLRILRLSKRRHVIPITGTGEGLEDGPAPWPALIPRIRRFDWPDRN